MVFQVAIINNLELAQLVKSICHPWPKARSDLVIGAGHTEVNEIVSLLEKFKLYW